MKPVILRYSRGRGRGGRHLREPPVPLKGINRALKPAFMCHRAPTRRHVVDRCERLTLLHCHCFKRYTQAIYRKDATGKRSKHRNDGLCMKFVTNNRKQRNPDLNAGSNIVRTVPPGLEGHEQSAYRIPEIRQSERKLSQKSLQKLVFMITARDSGFSLCNSVDSVETVPFHSRANVPNSTARVRAARNQHDKLHTTADAAIFHQLKKTGCLSGTVALLGNRV